MVKERNVKNCVLTTVFLLAVSVSTSNVFATGTYDGGDGSQGNPFQINTAAQMDEVGQHSEDWGSYFILTADIDLAGYTGTAFNIIGNTATPFTGSFDGNGHTISNFTYTTTGTNYIGLFSWVGAGGEIKDLGLTNVNVDAGTGMYVGGLVGSNYGTVSNSYATSSVSGNNYIGGLVGHNRVRVSNCYATGSVMGNDKVGGLVGYNTYSTVSKCYAIGSILGTSNVGGLVGWNYNSNIFASFWDTQTTGQSAGVGLIEGSGTVEVYGRTTAQMQTESTFTNADWDFINVWNIGKNQTYPYLRVYLAADLNKDGIVNFLDIAITANQWIEGVE